MWVVGFSKTRNTSSERRNFDFVIISRPKGILSLIDKVRREILNLDNLVQIGILTCIYLSIHLVICVKERMLMESIGMNVCILLVCGLPFLNVLIENISTESLYFRAERKSPFFGLKACISFKYWKLGFFVL